MYGCMAVAYPFGNFVSIYIYTYGGSIAIWTTCLAIGVLTIVYILCFITDSRGREEEQLMDCQNDTSSSCAEPEEGRSACLSAVTNLWESITVTFQARDGYKRARLVLLLASMSIFVFQLGTSLTAFSFVVVSSIFI